MASITQHYGIHRPVTFENVDVGRDNRRYVDPHLLRLRATPTPFAQDALRCLDAFFDGISRAAMSSDATSRAHALDTLQQFKEPWETRLGMARQGFRGHGGARDIGSRIWEAMTSDLEALLNVGILKHLEHLPLFVEGVDNDITSDITTRIVFGPLADFTAAMLKEHSEFETHPHTTHEFDRQVWDPAIGAWSTRRVRLPIVEGRPLLLVPKGWVRGNLLMSPTRFYETSLLSYVQAEQEVVLSSGEILRTPKDRLKAQGGLRRGRTTHLEITTRAHTAGDDLVDIFRDFVRVRFDSSGESDAA